MFMVNRRRFLTGAGALAGAAGLGGYASAYEAGMRLDLTPYDISSPNWPADLPLKIAVIADIHACEPWMPAERIASIVDLANAQKPDLTVLLGDFAGAQHFVTRYVPPGAWAEQLARLEALLGVYAILGNHDWWSAAMPTDPPDEAQSVRKALRSVRIPVLENRAVQLSLRGRPFWLATEDHDLEEVAGTLSFGEDYDVTPLADPGIRPAPQASVGYVKLSQEVNIALSKLEAKRLTYAGNSSRKTFWSGQRKQ